MLLLSRTTGQDVLGPDGRVVGRLADLSARLGGSGVRHEVERLHIVRSHAPDLLVPWTECAGFGPAGMRLSESAGLESFSTAAVDDALEHDELLLRRDVLDTQIVDVVGRRLARVADVLLARTADKRLELVGVEVGFGGVLRRLGLRRLAARFGEDAVAWTDLHLTSDRGHDVQLASPRSAVHHLDARGLAGLVSRLATEAAAEVLAAAEPSVAAGAVRAADSVVGARVLRAMPETEVAEIVDAMPAEHAARWRDRLTQTSVLHGRHFLRSRVWPPRRHTLDSDTEKMP